MYLHGLRSFINSSLKNRIISMIVCIAIIPFSVIYAYVFFNLRNEIKAEYVLGTQQTLNKFSELINRKLLEYVQKSKYIAADRNIVENIGRDFTDDTDQLVSFYKSANELIANMGIFDGVESSRYTIYFSNKSLFEYKYFKKIDKLKGNDLVQRKALSDMKFDALWSPGISTGETGDRYITLYKNIQTFSKIPCLLVIDIPFSNIELYLKSMDVPDGSLIIYKDGANNQIGAIEIGKQDHIDKDDINIKNYAFIESKLVNDHKLVVAIPRHDMNSKMVRTLIIMVAVFVLVISSIALVSVWTSKSMTRTLKEFIGTIKKEDDILLNNTDIEITGNDEVSIIKRKFGGLISKINMLHRENLEAYKNKKLLELELLQLKLNPHLLYNSLSVIKWGAMMNSDKKTVELVDYMTRYYRAVLSRGKNIIKIKEEINLIIDYIKINEFAHSANYNLTLHIENMIDEYYIIKLILQPIVENAILHGLNGKEGEKKILIRIFSEKEDIFIVVEDNGHGMKQDVIEKLCSQEFKKKIGGYGIKNLINRIKTYFGEDYYLRIESEEGYFTRVTLKIPMLDENVLIERVG